VSPFKGASSTSPAPWQSDKKSSYLRQGGYIIIVVCRFVCLSATLRKNFRTDLHEICREGWQWASE